MIERNFLIILKNSYLCLKFQVNMSSSKEYFLKATELFEGSEDLTITSTFSRYLLHINIASIF